MIDLARDQKDAELRSARLGGGLFAWVAEEDYRFALVHAIEDILVDDIAHLHWQAKEVRSSGVQHDKDLELSSEVAAIPYNRSRKPVVGGFLEGLNVMVEFSGRSWW